MESENLEKESNTIGITDTAMLVQNPSEVVNLDYAITPYTPRKKLVEPFMFFLFFAYTLYETILPNVIELQYCSAVLNISQDVCLNTTKGNKEKLQQFTSRFQIARSLIEVLLPGMFSFFVGPWSDTYGRKPLMLSASIGYSITYALWTVGSTIPSLEPIYFLLFSIPLCLSGGGSVIILSAFCYVCDVTDVKNRAARLGRLQASLFVGSLISTLLCPLLLQYGSTVVFAIATSCVYLSVFSVYVFIDESIIPSRIDLNSVNRNPFAWEHIRGLIDSCYVKQTPRVRLTIVLLTLILSCSLTNLFGESNTLYLFLQEILDWKLEQYTQLSAYIILVNAIGAAGGTWLFSTKLKLNDLLVLSLAAFFRLISSLIMIFGFHVWHIYLAKIISCTIGISGPLIRSFLSQVIPKDDLGKVFSLLSSCESFTPLFASLIYSTLYSDTLTTFPGAIFILSAFLILIMLILLTILVQMYIPDSSSLLKKRTADVEVHVSSSSPSINP